jgi:hypothetical protein
MVGLHDTVGSVRPQSDNKAVQYSLSYIRCNVTNAKLQGMRQAQLWMCPQKQLADCIVHLSGTFDHGWCCLLPIKTREKEVEAAAALLAHAAYQSAPSAHHPKKAPAAATARSSTAGMRCPNKSTSGKLPGCVVGTNRKGGAFQSNPTPPPPWPGAAGGRCSGGLQVLQDDCCFADVRKLVPQSSGLTRDVGVPLPVLAEGHRLHSWQP